jgi:hypothetical protein
MTRRHSSRIQSRRRPSTPDPVVEARQYLTKLGVVEDSGERRRGRNGEMQIVWRISALGHIVGHYLDQGFTFEEAMALARSSIS